MSQDNITATVPTIQVDESPKSSVQFEDPPALQDVATTTTMEILEPAEEEPTQEALVDSQQDAVNASDTVEVPSAQKEAKEDDAPTEVPVDSQQDAVDAPDAAAVPSVQEEAKEKPAAHDALVDSQQDAVDAVDASDAPEAAAVEVLSVQEEAKENDPPSEADGSKTQIAKIISVCTQKVVGNVVDAPEAAAEAAAPTEEGEDKENCPPDLSVAHDTKTEAETKHPSASDDGIQDLPASMTETAEEGVISVCDVDQEPTEDCVAKKNDPTANSDSNSSRAPDENASGSTIELTTEEVIQESEEVEKSAGSAEQTEMEVISIADSDQEPAEDAVKANDSAANPDPSDPRAPGEAVEEKLSSAMEVTAEVVIEVSKEVEEPAPSSVEQAEKGVVSPADSDRRPAEDAMEVTVKETQLLSISKGVAPALSNEPARKVESIVPLDSVVQDLEEVEINAKLNTSVVEDLEEVAKVNFATPCKFPVEVDEREANSSTAGGEVSAEGADRGSPRTIMDVPNASAENGVGLKRKSVGGNTPTTPVLGSDPKRIRIN